MSDTATTQDSLGQKILAWFQTAEQDVGNFLVKVAQGAEVVISEIESIASYVETHLGIIQTGIAAVTTVAAGVAPGNPTVQKVLDDLNTGFNDVAALSQGLNGGSTANDPAIVTTAVNTINAVKQLNVLVSQAGSQLTTLVANQPGATQAVTPASPSPTA